MRILFVEVHEGFADSVADRLGREGHIVDI
jgi:hypothetical protein